MDEAGVGGIGGIALKLEEVGIIDEKERRKKGSKGKDGKGREGGQRGKVRRPPPSPWLSLSSLPPLLLSLVIALPCFALPCLVSSCRVPRPARYIPTSLSIGTHPSFPTILSNQVPTSLHITSHYILSQTPHHTTLHGTTSISVIRRANEGAEYCCRRKDSFFLSMSPLVQDDVLSNVQCEQTTTTTLEHACQPASQQANLARLQCIQ